MSGLRGRHEAVDEQVRKFDRSMEPVADRLPVQVVTLVIRNASDTRMWYWDDVLNEDDVLLVGWTDTTEVQ